MLMKMEEKDQHLRQVVQLLSDLVLHTCAILCHVLPTHIMLAMGSLSPVSHTSLPSLFWSQGSGT